MKKVKIAGLMLATFAFNGYAVDETMSAKEAAYHKLIKNGVFYDGEKNPGNMPKYAVMMSFVERIVSLDTDEYGQQRSEYIFNKIGIDEEKIDKIKLHSRDALAKAQNVSKQAAVCDYLSAQAKIATKSRVADIINQKDNEKRDIFMAAYREIRKVLSNAQMNRFEQYLLTDVAANMTYIVSRKLMADSVNMQKHTKYCN